jgi:hypothetical protein
MRNIPLPLRLSLVKLVLDRRVLVKRVLKRLVHSGSRPRAVGVRVPPWFSSRSSMIRQQLGTIP